MARAMALLKDFKAFAVKGNVVDLGVAVMIGGAFGKIVTAVVDDVVMPAVGGIIPGGEWRTWTVTPLQLKLGHLIGSILDFTVIATVLFVVVVKLMGALARKDAPNTRTCPECLETVPLAARRCRACTSPLPAGEAT